MYDNSVFKRELRTLKRHFTNASADVVIPSPLMAAKDVIDAVADHIRYARAEQEAFQQRIQAVGLTRISKMTPQEVIQQYGCD